jgi:death-on-curing protein
VSNEPEFLTVDDVLEIHRDVIERYGGDDGIRDYGLLESAVAIPQQSFGGEYLHRDIFEMAAAYAFHLAESGDHRARRTRTAASTARMSRHSNHCTGFAHGARTRRCCHAGSAGNR